VTLTVSTKIARAVATTGDVLRRAAEPAWLRVLALASVAGMATSYAPLALTMKLGDIVVWRNEDPFPHTATAAGVFDSKSIAAGASWKYRPEAAGKYAYICTFHPNMKGTLKVE
jgi:plastocyanin